MSLATAFSLLGDQLLYSVLPTHFTELGLLPYQVGLLLSANRWIRLLTNHLAERVCRRCHPGLLLALSLGLGALLTAVYGLSSSFSVLLGARMLWGLCWSFIRQIGLMTVVDGAVESHLGQWMGFYGGISRIGSVSGNLMGALGHDLVGFTAILLVFAVVSLLAVPLGAWSRRGLKCAAKRSERQAPDAQPRAGLLFCGFVMGCVGHGLMMSTLGLVLKEEVGETVTVAGVTIGVATLTGLLLAGRWIADLCAPAMGAFADRIGRRMGAFVFFVSGALVLGSAAVVSGGVTLVLLVLSFFVCATGVTVALVAEAGLGGPRAVASYVTAADLGAAAGPMLGWMAPQWGFPTETALALGGLLYALAGASALLSVGKAR